jgi:hypothetical protein
MAKRGSKKWKANLVAGQKRRRESHPSKFDGLDRDLLRHFIYMFNRVHMGKAPYIKWPRTKEGFYAFVKEVGPKPSDGQKWSIGRIDHEKGYEEGNVRWELFLYNSVKRRGTRHENSREAIVELRPGPKFKLGSEEWYEHQAKASNARWAKLRTEKQMSKLMKGNQNASGSD